MADFSEHIHQFEHNIKALCALCVNSPDLFWDWKTTISFYSALHLIRAHLAHHGEHPLTHTRLSVLVSPANGMKTKITEAAYLAYDKLRMDSEKARYLKLAQHIGGQEIRFINGITRLETIMQEFGKVYPGYLSSFDLHHYKEITNSHLYIIYKQQA